MGGAKSKRAGLDLGFKTRTQEKQEVGAYLSEARTWYHVKDFLHKLKDIPVWSELSKRFPDGASYLTSYRGLPDFSTGIKKNYLFDTWVDSGVPGDGFTVIWDKWEDMLEGETKGVSAQNALKRFTDYVSSSDPQVMIEILANTLWRRIKNEEQYGSVTGGALDEQVQAFKLLESATRELYPRVAESVFRSNDRE